MSPGAPRPSPEWGTHVGDLAEGAHGRAPVAVLLAGHVLGQAAGTRRGPHAGPGLLPRPTHPTRISRPVSRRVSALGS